LNGGALPRRRYAGAEATFRTKVDHLGLALSAGADANLRSQIAMLPISDENPTKRFPIVTVLLIAANVAVFFAWQICVGLPHSVALAGLTPTELKPVSLPGVGHLFTSMFMHGGIAHLLGNMWFLWIFGDNVEDEIGRIKFVIFYLLTGVAGAVSHVALNAQSVVPMVGASGAISGVLGAYLVLHPAARVKMLLWIRFVRIPAWCYLSIWIGLQVLALSQASRITGIRIAYWAHIGGFVTGMFLSMFVTTRQNPKDF
jgi:membrane associated rhomboid family serine protease